MSEYFEDCVTILAFVLELLLIHQFDEDVQKLPVRGLHGPMLNCEDLVELLLRWLDLCNSTVLDLLDRGLTSVDHCDLHVRLGLRCVLIFLAGHLHAAGTLLLNLSIRSGGTSLCDRCDLRSVGLRFLFCLCCL